jgi:hypothetical protein
VKVDIVTSARFLHQNMSNISSPPCSGLPINFCPLGSTTQSSISKGIWPMAYRPLRRQEKNEVDVWPVTLSIGNPLPLFPLALKGFQAVPLDLEAASTDARQRSRL